MPIVTVPDPITGGAGAAVTTTQVINAMWDNSQTRTNESNARISAGLGDVGPAPIIGVPTLDMSYVPPLAPQLLDPSIMDGEAIYNTQLQKLVDLIGQGIADFFQNYFPLGPYDDAVEWLRKAIVDGGTGLSAGVEQQLWERGKARLLEESMEAEASLTESWAARGYPLPPGALVYGLQRIQLDRSRKLAEQSRDIAIKSFDTEIENVRFAVQQTLDLRSKAMSAMADYIRTLMMGPQTAMQLATGLAGLELDANRSMVALYSAEVQALQPRVQLAIEDARLQASTNEANQRSIVATAQSKADLAKAAATMLASQAAAGINAINAQTQISASDRSDV
ncbi:hypothetical protein J2W32_004483 [Variovorax boronicumulans]|uniref:Uncharacterized protein n=1 Tax=Variovorax boronicumulans TaxID=436515 RepID=A0AAW8D7V6_9BURK|nr:hypothetical protein [Variovorax boronicumulans]MDP9895385.1 hypothetical protein [Variovorax boronicumulans]MDQ0055425.1 hypothetical protein [Variovorax boronicumulans]